MNASIDVSSSRSDVAVIALIGFVHAVSHFFHLVIPVLFPWLMPAFGLSYTQAGALMTIFFAISGLGFYRHGECFQFFRQFSCLGGALG